MEMRQEEEKEGSKTPKIADRFQQLPGGNDKRGTREAREDTSEICNRSRRGGRFRYRGSRQNLKEDERG